jgi:site-specific recombinase XerD
LLGYQSDWRHFLEWCREHKICPLPAAVENVAAYIAECAGHLKTGSIQRRLNAISEAHKAVGIESPTSAGMVRNTLKGIRRTIGVAAVQKSPTLTADIRAMIDVTDTGFIGSRDRALTLLAFAGAFRRSEMVGLDSGDCSFTKDGLTARV